MLEFSDLQGPDVTIELTVDRIQLRVYISLEIWPSFPDDLYSVPVHDLALQLQLPRRTHWWLINVSLLQLLNHDTIHLTVQSCHPPVYSRNCTIHCMCMGMCSFPVSADG